MMSAFTPRSSRQKAVAKIQFVVLTVALLLALVVLPASADHEEEAEYTFAFEEASASSTVGLDASSTRLAALGEFYTAKMLEAGHKANSGRYNQLAAFYAGSDGGTDRWAAGAGDYGTKNLAAAGTEDSGFLAENPETKYASGWGGASAGAATGASENPELSSFQRYCGC
jgi:hypothetical protein